MHPAWPEAVNMLDLLTLVALGPRGCVCGNVCRVLVAVFFFKAPLRLDAKNVYVSAAHCPITAT